MQEENSRDIKIPIKSIVEQAMFRNGASYQEDEFNLLRKYFIACLNLGYLVPENLEVMVNKFAQRIKLIVLNYNNFNKMDCYVINEGVLYINGSLKDTNDTFYEINFYKAVTEVLFEVTNTYLGLSSALTEIVAEKVYNMDVNGSRIIMPKTEQEKIGNELIEVRTGYLNYNLVISLAKQLLISLDINENKLIRRLFFEKFNDVIKTDFSDSKNILLLDVLDKLCLMYINRKTKGITNPSEIEVLNKYQILINDNFKTVNQNYLAFCALITTDALRKQCMSKFNISGEGA